MGRSQINWPLYNNALVNRGNITFWFSKDVAKSWYNKKKTGGRGASNTYSQAAIDTISMIRFWNILQSRALPGLPKIVPPASTAFFANASTSAGESAPAEFYQQ